MMVEANDNQQPKRRAFLAAYAVTGAIGKAADAAGINRCTHSEWMKDPEYAGLFEEAREAAAEMLESEARRRAIDGVVRLKFCEGEAIVDPHTKEPYREIVYSDTLLIFLMKGAMPQKYCERQEIKHEGLAALYTDPRDKHGRAGVVKASGD
jgi:hypothetical protein